MKTNVNKAISAMIIVLFASQIVLAQQNGKPQPQGNWFSKGKDTVATGKVVQVNNTLEADSINVDDGMVVNGPIVANTIHSKGPVVIGDSSFAFIPSSGIPPTDQIRSSLGLITIGKGDSTSIPNFSDIKVGIGTINPGFMLDVLEDVNIGANRGYFINGNKVLHNIGLNSISVGVRAGDNNTGGFRNTFVGHEAGQNASTVLQSSFFGYRAGQNSSGTGNSFFGVQTGLVNSGGLNTLIGFAISNGSGNRNTMVGSNMGAGSGSDNSFLGHKAGASSGSGNQNSYVGFQAGQFHFSGNNNSFLGSNAGRNNNTGTFNTFIGANADGYY